MLVAPPLTHLSRLAQVTALEGISTKRWHKYLETLRFEAALSGGLVCELRPSV